jgi:hypothetical protein
MNDELDNVSPRRGKTRRLKDVKISEVLLVSRPAIGEKFLLLKSACVKEDTNVGMIKDLFQLQKNGDGELEILIKGCGEPAFRRPTGNQLGDGLHCKAGAARG